MQRLIDEVASTNLGIILDPTNLIRVDIDKTYLEIVEEAFECFGEKNRCFSFERFHYKKSADISGSHWRRAGTS